MSAHVPYRTTRQVKWWLLGTAMLLASLVAIPALIESLQLDRRDLATLVACIVVAVGIGDWGYQTFLGRRAGLVGAVRYGNSERTQTMLAHGVNADRRDVRGKCALHYAVEKGEMDTVGLLLGYGASPSVRDRDGATPLHYAAALRTLPSDTQERMVLYLLSAGADPNARDVCDRTALDWADAEPIRRVLVDAGARPAL